MSDKDWDLDELLNFEYDSPKPKPIEIPNHRIEKKTKPSLAPLRDEAPSARDVAIKEAQEAAYLKYRQEYAAKKKKAEGRSAKKVEKADRKAEKKALKAERKAMKAEKKAAKKTSTKATKKTATKSVATVATQTSKLYKFTKFLCVPYVLLFAVFTIAMTVMNVLPFWMLLALYIVLGLLSLIIVIQLTKNNIKKWAKVLATIMAMILMLAYGVGTAYALGTLSFLDFTSVNNAYKVGKITKEPFNTMMTGIDVYGKIKTQGRSDVNMIVTVNPQTEQILLTSIPRDYEVRMPDKGYATDKLTHTGFYSTDCTKQSLEDLLQTTINYYVRVNFSTVYLFIDAIGGIDVESPETFNPVKMPEWTVQQGMNHMSGKQALAFARERKAFLAGDNERIKNQQLVFESMFNKATSSKTMAISYSHILSKTKKYFEMSFSSREIRSLVKLQLAKGIKWKIYKNTLTGSGATKGTYTTGSQGVYVTEQDPTSVANAQALIQAVIDGKQLAEDENGDAYIVGETEEATND